MTVKSDWRIEIKLEQAPNIKSVIINRHNYEEFFLLYIDNELNEAQRLEVENFAQQNPDLAQELEMLKQSTLIADDDVKFDDKELLFKKEAGINAANYEEYFLLSIDNELTEQEQSQVEKFVLKHPELQDEFTVLKQTKLEPEVIEFAAKETLYRTEKKERRVIPITWMRMSVAAAVVVLAVSMWLLNGNKTSDADRLASNIKTSTPKPVTTTNSNNATVTKEAVASLSGKKEPEVASSQIAIAKTSRKENSKASNHTNSLTTKTDDVSDEKYLPNEQLAQVEIVKPLEEKPNSVAVIAANNVNRNSNVLNNNLIKSAEKQNADVEKSIVHDGVYREVDTDDDDNTISIGAAQINKNKLRALFKKATNLLDRKVGRNESEKTVQIASFEIKSK
jgi:hypothetical protein